ncbi:hypothetical protein ACTXT7_005581 [Hymenolepis weldensis]
MSSEEALTKFSSNIVDDIGIGGVLTTLAFHKAKSIRKCLLAASFNLGLTSSSTNMQNAGKQNDLIEFTRIGLIHSPSGRLLTSETFQGALNVQGVSLKRKQIWTLYTELSKPTAFLLRNHQGNFLSADGNGKVSLTPEKRGGEGRFIIHFDPKASGEIALQSEAHGFFLHWSGREIRCFSKEPVWWGIRLAMHPQSVDNNYVYGAGDATVDVLLGEVRRRLLYLPVQT